MENNNNENDDDDSLFNTLFVPVEKIFADFDRLFSDFSSIFSIPSQDFNNESSPPSSASLRDEVLKQDNQYDRHGDENLDSTIEKHGLNGALQTNFSTSSLMTTMQRELTPSGRCYTEKKVQHSSNQNENSKTETTTKRCGDQYHTTVKQDGKILREYGNSTLDQLDQIDSSPSDNDNSPIIGGNRHSDFFKKLFS